MSLDVCLRGEQVGSLTRAGDGGYEFAYSPGAIERDAAGKAVSLSRSLPVRPGPHGAEAARAYVEGLLPQGVRREAIARRLGLDPGDGYGLIAELGADCLGAVTIGRGLGGAGPAGPGSLSWLTDAELEELLELWPEQLFDEADPHRMRFALPGERHKLALVRDEGEDRWAWPQPGVPSTHILKPEPPELPGMAANEHASSLAYRALGFPVAHTEAATIAGHPCLVAKRFDRWGEGQASALHQESFAQALGICPDEASCRLSPGAPMLSEVAALLREIDEADAVQTLLRVTVCDVLLGCTELRGTNAALLYGGAGPMLAPFYDIASTEIYGAVRPRPIVIGTDVPPAPLLIDLRHAIELCDMEFQPALIDSVELMGPLGSALNSAADGAQAEGWHHAAIEAALQIVFKRTKGFGQEFQYLCPPGA
jgi:serine/threonine-protein kinase HipA